MVTKRKTAKPKKPKPKLMTQKQAWVYLANLWGVAASKSKTEVVVCPTLRGCEFCYGLCSSIGELRDSNMISQTIYAVMFKAIKKAAPKKTIYHYYWPISKEGSEKRAAFCRKMARILAMGLKS